MNSHPVDESQLLERILEKRGIGKADLSHFLHPVFKRDLHEASLLPDMEVAIERIADAISLGERIVIFGDYDADGVPATALLLRTLSRAGAIVQGIIPLRSEGYGLTAGAVKRIKESGAGLLIAADNGTVARQEIAELRASGIETIVCDHHEPQGGNLAEPLALINPKRQDSQYPCRDLCACALVWKLSWALYERLELPTAPLKWELDLVALSTVADMVPLLGENRTLVQFGLQALRRSKNIGLQALAKVAGFDLAQATSQDIGFKLAPRLNATSRMHDELLEGTNASLELLITEDLSRAQRCAKHLQCCNVERQALVLCHIEEAERQIVGHQDELCLVLYADDWSSGVIGLVAGRICEAYKRPVVALALEGGELKGSVRSVNGVSVLDLLASAEQAFTRFGGHAKAGGLTMNGTIEISELQERLCGWLRAEGRTLESFATAQNKIPDLELPLDQVSLQLADELQELGPYGTGFEELLLSSRVQVNASRMVGSTGKHFSCRLSDGSEQLKAIGFGFEDPGIAPSGWYQAEYTLQAEEWQGRRTAGCILKRLVRI